MKNSSLSSLTRCFLIEVNIKKSKKSKQIDRVKKFLGMRSKALFIWRKTNRENRRRPRREKEIKFLAYRKKSIHWKMWTGMTKSTCKRNPEEKLLINHTTLNSYRSEKIQTWKSKQTKKSPIFSFCFIAFITLPFHQHIHPPPFVWLFLQQQKTHQPTLFHRRLFFSSHQHHHHHDHLALRNSLALSPFPSLSISTALALHAHIRLSSTRLFTNDSSSSSSHFALFTLTHTQPSNTMGRGKPYKQIISNKKEKKNWNSIRQNKTNKKQFHIYTTVIFKANREKGKTTNKKEGGASGANIDTFLNGQNTERKKISSIMNKCKKNTAKQQI